MTDKQFYTDLLAKQDWELREYYNLLDNQHDYLADQVNLGREEKREEFNQYGRWMDAVEMERVRRLGDPGTMLNDRGLIALHLYCRIAFGFVGDTHPKAAELRATMNEISDIWAQQDWEADRLDQSHPGAR